ncbi:MULTISPECIES: invasion associated locus B family protein [Rhodobacterales]|uniref:invasion associated locus B family protein n=1 Tax=Roseobacter sp. N2S TaxID=2663844 RepID=UPI00286566F2|nr:MULTISPECIES: invasion associated locus B family protein [Rhodobacterales]MDR6265328.1 invasion protein IalB [Roseobacter sp. N2S]
MKNTLIPFALVLLLAAPVVHAQETTTETTEATTQTETAPADQANAADSEYKVADENAAPEEGQGYLKEEHGQWQVRCIKAPEGEEEVCRLFNLLTDKDGNSIAQLDMQALPKGGKAVAGVDMATPLGTLLTAQLVMKIDAAKAKRYPYTWCDNLGCYARFGMTAGEIDAMKKGVTTVVTIASVAAPEEPLELELSLSGFTAAWTAIAPK